MRVKFLLIAIGFASGFLIHAFFFPDILSNGIVVTPETLLSNEVTPVPENEKHELFTHITYDGHKFSRTNVTVRLADYVTITNESEDTLMSLASDEPLLTTPRGYGYKEQVKARLDEKKTITVQDANNPKTQLMITVK